MTRNEFLDEVVDTVTCERSDSWIMGICAVILLVLLVSLSGCSAMKTTPTVASVNQSITTAIADAGTVANQAEQEYQSGQLPQTAAIRTAINDLGTAYNDAKSAYVVELQATAAYQSAEMQQMAACAPAAAPAGNGAAPTPAATATTNMTPSQECQALTVTANARKVAETNAATQLNQKVSALASKTSAVKSLSK